ncbi:helix-turn-helix domain-containing protein [Xanthomonas translucens]
MDLGSRIRAARIAAGYSQGELSELCGWGAPSRLSNYEQGVREPALADLRLIASNVARGGHTYARIVLGDETASGEQRFTAAVVMDAARVAASALPAPRKLDPTDPDDALLLAIALAALMR